MIISNLMIISNYYFFSLKLIVHIVFSLQRTIAGHFQELSDKEEIEIPF